jgi:hypothetical protein
MTTIKMAYRVLEEEQRLLWADDIWNIASEKGYTKELSRKYEQLEHNINALDNTLFDQVGKGQLRLLEKEGLYYLTSFEQLPSKIEDALHGPTMRSFAEVVKRNRPKHFRPCTRGFDGMVLFFILAVGLPLSLYLTTLIQGNLAFSLLSLFWMLGLLSGFGLLAYAYLQWSNAAITISPKQLECYYAFYPKRLKFQLAWSQLSKIEARGLGEELQLKSDIKYLIFYYSNEKGQPQQRLVRCHGYINPSPHYDPFSVQVRNYESFVLLRQFLKEVAALYDIPYEEK